MWSWTSVKGFSSTELRIPLQLVLVKTLVEVFDVFSNYQEVMVTILELFSIIDENYITFLNEVPAVLNIPYNIYNDIVIIRLLKKLKI